MLHTSARGTQLRCRGVRARRGAEPALRLLRGARHRATGASPHARRSLRARFEAEVRSPSRTYHKTRRTVTESSSQSLKTLSCLLKFTAPRH